MDKILIGLPAYNESISIAKLLDRINIVREDFQGQMDVLVVNDGSSDDTEDYLKEYRDKYPHITYINHSTNQGLAQGMRTIINFANVSLNDYDALIVLDADNTHNPDIIPGMVKKLHRNNLDIVIASRFEKGGQEIGLSFYRKILSRGARLFASIVFNVENVKDYSCGFRAYRLDILRDMKEHYKDELIEAEGFECMIELIVKAGKIGARIDEYPLVLEYNLKESPSEMKAMRTIKGYFRLAFKHNRLKGKVHRK